MAGWTHCGCLALALWLFAAVGALAQQEGAAGVQGLPLAAAARLDPAASRLDDLGARGLELALTLSQPVPWRVRVFDDPPRLVLEARQIDWGGFGAQSHAQPRALAGLAVGQGGDGWSRLVLEMRAPFEVASAGMQVDTETGMAQITLRLGPASAEAFAAALSPGAAPPLRPGMETTAPGEARPAAPEPALPPVPAPLPRPAIVVLDPGHGGRDPGAQHGDLREADLMLTFARELREAFRRVDGIEVVLTREEDIFLSLAERLRIARAADADLFLSLHADALDEGQASGATVYTRAEEATGPRAAALAAHHDRADLLAGVDIGTADDMVAGLLVALAEVETRPRAALLSENLVEAIGAAGLQLHSRPLQAAAFRVLMAPDTPSVLVELGFLSSARDRARLIDPDWRTRMAGALVAGVQAYLAADAAEDPLRRR